MRVSTTLFSLLPMPAFALALVVAASPAAARVLTVGKGQAYSKPSEASWEAKAGDTVRIAPGTYYDCAVWEADDLVIEGAGPDVVLTDTTCEEKAIFVVRGNNVTIRNIQFQRARVPDRNGAGIRAEGRDLTVEGSRFVDNENGILAAPSEGSTIRILRSEFVNNGRCEGDEDCAHGIYVNQAALLEIRDSVFRGTRTAHHIKSRALRTVIEHNQILDGPTGTSSYLVDVPNGGSLVLRDNIMQKGPRTSNRSAAVKIGAEGVTQPSEEITITGNMFSSDVPTPVAFIDNITATPAVLRGNTIKGKVVPLRGDGSND